MNTSQADNQLHVRAATTSDIDFIVASNRAMAAETEDTGLDTQVLTRGITHLLRNPTEGFYLVAQSNHAPAGTLMVTFEWSDWRAGRFWWIQSVYVSPQYRRQGVYTALHAAVRERAGQDPLACGIRLYVEQENVTAQQTYQHLGMYRTHYQLFEELF
jgi:ribosomal protein S18 acetylase RimI-like enzyme